MPLIPRFPKNPPKTSFLSVAGIPAVTVFILASGSFLPGSAARANDAQLLDYLDQNCSEPSSAGLRDLCSSLGWGSGSSGGANVNSMTVSTQSLAAISAAQNAKSSVEERVEKLKKCQNGSGYKKGSKEAKECDELKTGASADELVSNLGFFFNGMYNEKDRKQIRETGFKSELEGFVGGFDYRFTDWLLAGFAVGHSSERADFYNNAGSLETESWNYNLYSTITPMENTYIDLYAGYSDIEHDSLRNFSITNPAGTVFTGSAFGQTEADLYMAGFTAGYTWSWQGLSIDPRIKLDYSWTDVDSFQENTSGPALNMALPEQHRRSLTTSFGSQISYALSIPGGVLVPQARAYYVHEYKNDARTLTNSLVVASDSLFTDLTDDPDRDYMIWGAGVVTALPHGVQLFADFEQIAAHRYLSSWTATGGLRLEF
jgi:outer membrane lipase/esterase